MVILGRIPGFGSQEYEDEEPDYEVIYKGHSNNNEPGAQDDELQFNPHQMISDTIGSVDIFSNNPYGPKDIDDEVSSVKALKLFDDTGEYVARNNSGRDLCRDGTFRVRYNISRESTGEIMYTMAVSERRSRIHRGHRPEGRGHSSYATSFNGKLAENVPKDDVERFVSQYGFDRHTDGWMFDNLEGKLDEFLEIEDYAEVFSASASDVRDAVVAGEVRSAEYYGKDYAHWDDREIIAALLEDSSESAEVHELEHSGRFNYDVILEEDDLMGGEELRLELVSTRPLFPEKGDEAQETRAAEAEITN